MLKRIFSKRNLPLWGAALLSGAIMYMAYPPAPAGGRTGAFFALVPLLAAVRSGISPRKSAFFFFAAGMFFWPATLSWFPAIVPNGGPWPLVALGWFGLSAVCSLFFALFGWLDALLWKAAGDAPSWRRLPAVPAEAVLWAGVELLRGNVFTGFPWNFLGTPLGAFPKAAALARFGGVYAVSALAVAVSGAMASFAARAVRPLAGLPPDPRTLRARLLRSAEAWIAFALAMACFCIPPPAEVADADSETVNVVLLQRDFPCVFRRPDGKSRGAEVYRKLMMEARDAAGRRVWCGADAAADGRFMQADLAVLPESALCEFGTADASALLGWMVSSPGVSVLAGCDHAVRDAQDGLRFYNSALLADAMDPGARPHIYSKRHLVPFGEYIPFDKTFPALQGLCPLGVSLWPGDRPVLDLRLRSGADVKIAPLICYEDTDASVVRESAKAGAQLLAVITNDNWFWGSIEPVQHFEQSVFRAVETGLPLVRAGNTGVTGIVLPDGTRKTLDGPDGKPLVDAPGSMACTVRVPKNPAPTPYTSLGDIPLAVLSSIAAAAALLQCARGRRPGPAPRAGRKKPCGGRVVGV